MIFNIPLTVLFGLHPASPTPDVVSVQIFPEPRNGQISHLHGFRVFTISMNQFRRKMRPISQDGNTNSHYSNLSQSNNLLNCVLRGNHDEGLIVAR
jgi:hypothetical protein